MIILLVGIALILYGLIAGKRYSVWVGMAFVLLIMGFQEGVPGDYYNYELVYSRGATGGAEGGSIKENEFSYVWLANTCKKFMSFHGYVLITSLVQCFIIALLIKKNADKRYQYFGVLITFFTLNIMLLQMKAMRQGYAVEMMLLAYLLLGQRRFLLSLISIIVAYGFHNSMIIALPFYVILFILLLWDVRSRRFQSQATLSKPKAIVHTLSPVIISVAFLFTYYLGNYVLTGYITPFLDSLDFFEYERYTDEYSSQKTVATWIIIYYLVSTFAVAYYYIHEEDKFRRYLAFLSLVANFITIMVLGYGDIQRIAMYFIPFTIVVFPNVAALLEDKKGKTMALCYVAFNMIVLMYTSAKVMIAFDIYTGNGYGSYTFSFLNW